jgi:hypothetical protein
VACITINGLRLGLDDDNKPFPLRGPLFKEAFPEIMSQDVDERARLLRFIKVFAPSAKELYPKIVRLACAHANDVVFDLNDGVRVFWGPLEEEKIAPKLAKLNQVFTDSRKRFPAIEYVNLFFYDDGRIIVKPKDQQQLAAEAAAAQAAQAALAAQAAKAAQTAPAAQVMPAVAAPAPALTLAPAPAPAPAKQKARARRNGRAIRISSTR